MGFTPDLTTKEEGPGCSALGFGGGRVKLDFLSGLTLFFLDTLVYQAGAFKAYAPATRVRQSVSVTSIRGCKRTGLVFFLAPKRGNAF